MIQFAVIMLSTFAAMELVAYIAHRWLFHGVLWFLHRSHHEAKKPGLELNDVFGPFFAIIAIILIGGYAAPDLLALTRPIGAGMTLYGAVYFFVHDMYTHRRFWRFDLPGRWLSEMRKAHRHHHSVVTKAGQEPFGFIVFQTVKAQPKLRTPSSSRSVTTLLLVALIGSATISGCTSIARDLIKEPKVALSNINVRDVGVNGATVVVGVQVQNPNAFALRLDGLKYNLEIGGKALSMGELPEAVNVAGSETKVIEIPVPVKFQDLYSSMFDFLQKSSSQYRVSGEARFGLLTVPFDKTGDLKLK